MIDDKIEAFLADTDAYIKYLHIYQTEPFKKLIALVRCYRKANQYTIASPYMPPEAQSHYIIAQNAEAKAKEIINGENYVDSWSKK